MSWKHWFHGLISAFIGGAAASIGVIIADPANFNPLNGGMKKLLLVAGISGLVTAAAYLKQSPLPGGDDKLQLPPIAKALFLALALSLAAGPGWAADIEVYGARYASQNVKVGPVTLAFGAADTTKSFTISAKAFINSMILSLANWTNNVTGTITVTNDNSRDLYTKASLARNTVHVIQDLAPFGYIPVNGQYTVTVTLSGAPGGSGGSASVDLYLQ